MDYSLYKFYIPIRQYSNNNYIRIWRQAIAYFYYILWIHLDPIAVLLCKQTGT